MKKVFHQLDFLGPTSIIYINGDKRYKSNFGTILSLVCFILIIVVCLILFIIYVNNKEYIINQYLENNGNFSFKMNNNSIRFKILDNYNNIISEKILKIIPFYYNKNVEENMIQLNTTNCNLNDLKNNNFSKYIDNLNENDYICLSEKNKINLTITYNETNTSFLLFYIAKCINSTENNNHCLTNEQIESYILKTDIKILTILDNKIIRHNNKTSVNSYPYIRELNIIQGLFYQYNFIYKKILYKKDEGFLLHRYSKKDFYMLDFLNCNYNVFGGDYQSLYPNSLISIKIGLNNDYIHIYEIIFSKFQNCFTNMFGLSFFIYKIFYFINFLFVNGKMFTDLMDNNYIIDSKNKINKYAKEISSNKASFRINNNNNINNNISIKINNNNNENNINNDNNINNNNNNNNINNNNNNNNQSTNLILNNSNSVLNIPIPKPNFFKPVITNNNNNDDNKLTKKRYISLCESLRYNMKFLNQNNKKINYILFCENIIKNIISTENFLKKNFQFENILNKKKVDFNLSQRSKSNSISEMKSPVVLKSQRSKQEILDLKNNSNIITIIKEEEEN